MVGGWWLVVGGENSNKANLSAGLEGADGICKHARNVVLRVLDRTLHPRDGLLQRGQQAGIAETRQTNQRQHYNGSHLEVDVVGVRKRTLGSVVVETRQSALVKLKSFGCPLVRSFSSFSFSFLFRSFSSREEALFTDAS